MPHPVTYFGACVLPLLEMSYLFVYLYVSVGKWRTSDEIRPVIASANQFLHEFPLPALPPPSRSSQSH